MRSSGWYNERSATAVRAFRADLDYAMLRVTEAPERWPRYQGTTRRYIFQRFPFSLIYRMLLTSSPLLTTAAGRGIGLIAKTWDTRG